MSIYSNADEIIDELDAIRRDLLDVRIEYEITNDVPYSGYQDQGFYHIWVDRWIKGKFMITMHAIPDAQVEIGRGINSLTGIPTSQWFERTLFNATNRAFLSAVAASPIDKGVLKYGGHYKRTGQSYEGWKATYG